MALAMAMAMVACRGGGVGASDGPEIPPDSTPGDIDAGAPDAAVGLACPAPGALADGKPFEPYVLDGTRFFAGPALGWRWTVVGGPCDATFASEGKPTSFTLAGSDTPRLTFRPTQVGDYTIHLTITTAAGALDCAFVLHVGAPGLRVELCWPTSGRDDLDLHVHVPGRATPWFDDNDDCYYLNCAADSLTRVDWGYPGSPMTACFDGAVGPTAEAGMCPNPRLDQDNVNDAGRPEYTNIDVPDDRATYRVMANYFSGAGVTFPVATIYCAGRRVATFGDASDPVPGFQVSGGDGFGAMWRIADVTTRVDAYGVTTCDVAALHPRGQVTGYDVRIGDVGY